MVSVSRKTGQEQMQDGERPKHSPADELASLQAEFADALYQIESERNAARATSRRLSFELVEALNSPFKTLMRTMEFRILAWASRCSPPLPAKVADRFAKSARKRDPGRFDVNTPQDGSSRGATAYVSRGEEIEGGHAFDPALPTVLIISHDATRTGAPILSYNLARELSTRHNVIVYLLRGGDILPNFVEQSTRVVVGAAAADSIAAQEPVLRRIVQAARPAFAVVNSVEARATLPTLRVLGVPTVSLLHEFAAYTRPRSAFDDVIRTSTLTVFSTGLTRDNAIDNLSSARAPSVRIIAQGKCEVPVEHRSPEQREAERSWLSLKLRPQNGGPRRVVVLGAGSVHIRKGVDLFIETATRALAAAKDLDLRFVWIGHGYKPEDDFSYSVYLRDQLERAGVADRVTLLRETKEIEEAYRLSDLLLLTSRLDPLPNVAIDALCSGVPVLCFDRTTGIADFLTANGLGEDCVADYIDTSDLARKVVRLAADPSLLERVAAAGKAMAFREFDFGRYAGQIEALGAEAIDRQRASEEDRRAITASGRFRADFFSPPEFAGEPQEAAISRYIESAACGIGARKPEPGFHPYRFADSLPASAGATRDPYAAYIAAGCPVGFWTQPVLGLDHAPAAPCPDLRVALHVHAYFPDGLADLVRRLNLNTTRPDLFVSIRAGGDDRPVRECLAAYSGRIVELEPVPNRGRDIGPLLTQFGARLVSDYDVIGHVHLKQSRELRDREAVARWVEFLMENTVGGARSGAAMDAILAAMHDDPGTAIAYADDPNILGWGKNLSHAQAIGDRLGHGSLPETITFPVGTMFWMRSRLLQRFVDLALDWSDYPAEPVAYDGSMLHAIERLFGVLPGLEGMSSIVTNVRGMTR